MEKTKRRAHIVPGFTSPTTLSLAAVILRALKVPGVTNRGACFQPLAAHSYTHRLNLDLQVHASQGSNATLTTPHRQLVVSSTTAVHQYSFDAVQSSSSVSTAANTQRDHPAGDTIAFTNRHSQQSIRRGGQPRLQGRALLSSTNWRDLQVEV